jgi:uncharacterized RmlC-like cupin family protein
MSRGLTIVRAAERIPAAGQTEGIIREEALSTGMLWAGIARTAPGVSSGWHHHGAWETIAYVITGAVLLELGREGAEALRAEPGDFLRIPAKLVHRESNPTEVEQSLAVVRVGHGPVAINVETPEPRTKEGVS